jgi:hypothetical protein
LSFLEAAFESGAKVVDTVTKKILVYEERGTIGSDGNLDEVGRVEKPIWKISYWLLLLM